MPVKGKNISVHRRLSASALSLGLLLLAALACAFPLPTLTPPSLGNTPARAPEPVVVVATPTPLPEAMIAEATAEDRLLVNLYARVNPGVVNIDVAAGTGDEASIFGSGSGFL
ncbi:MAG: hypothetical protein D6793_04665, partial [Thermoflexia bacterium]